MKTNVSGERFLERLQAELKNFDTQKAQQLSLEIHEAEEAGYQVSPHEDRLWYHLTVKIADAKGTRLGDRLYDY
jgi:succinate dehydrogenase/fumarate reductase flavoprotein subunit